jgi:hypothetical protein
VLAPGRLEREITLSRWRSLRGWRLARFDPEQPETAISNAIEPHTIVLRFIAIDLRLLGFSAHGGSFLSPSKLGSAALDALLMEAAQVLTPS